MAIEVHDLTKRYGNLVAVDDVSFHVEHGECYGILGRNGAGKTTTLELIEGIRSPDAGTVELLGSSPWPRDPALLSRIGVQLQSGAFFERLTAIEQLRTVTDLYGVDRSEADDALERVGLSDSADRLASDLSGGQQQRLSIACAVAHRPEVLFLDEPSAGLDPTSRRNLWEVVESARAGGTTVVLTTHYMEEAEVLCDRVAILERGRVLADDTPAELIRRLDAPTRLLLPPDVLDVGQARAVRGVDDVAVDSGALTLISREPATAITQLAELGVLDGLQVRSGTLEDVFVDLTGSAPDVVEGPTPDAGAGPGTGAS